VTHRLCGPSLPRFAPCGCVGVGNGPASRAGRNPKGKADMHNRHRRIRLSEAEREQRRGAERERVKEAAEQLLTSGGWQRWVRARSMFRRYSAHNCMLIALDFHLRGINPEPVAGFRTWLKLGYCVRKGEHGIRIAARVTPKKAEPGAERTELQLDKRPVRFTTVSVFARLSRVRSGGCRRRPSREIRCLPVSRLCCSSAPASGTAVACAVVAEPAPEGDGAAAIARASPVPPGTEAR
jgi:hypothetical protein